MTVLFTRPLTWHAGLLIVFCAAMLTACDIGQSAGLTPTTARQAEITTSAAAPSPTVRAASVESVVERGPLANPPSVQGRDGGPSGVVGDKILWTFGDTFLARPNAQGMSGLSNSAALAPLTAPFSITSTQSATLDSVGEPLPVLPYNQEELDYNRARGNKGDDRYALWPSSVVGLKDGTGLIFYQKLVVKPGNFNVNAVGVGTALIRPGTTVAVRDPGLLFTSPETLFQETPVTGEGNNIYLYRCDQSSFLDIWCKVARAPLDKTRDRTAYRFWNGRDWVEDIKQGTSVTGGTTTGFSVSWNQYLNSYLAMYLAPLSQTVYMRTAPQPQGPWSAPMEAFKTLPPGKGSVNYVLTQHPEIAKDGGRTLYVSYYRPLEAFKGELRIVEVKLR